jgi:hypothetical protein
MNGPPPNKPSSPDNPILAFSPFPSPFWDMKVALDSKKIFFTRLQRKQQKKPVGGSLEHFLGL